MCTARHATHMWGIGSAYGLRSTGWAHLRQPLARISHHSPTAARDLPVVIALHSGRVLDVVSATPPRPTSRAPCLLRFAVLLRLQDRGNPSLGFPFDASRLTHGHLVPPATACDEKWGLALFCQADPSTGIPVINARQKEAVQRIRRRISRVSRTSARMGARATSGALMPINRPRLAMI